MKTDPNDFVPTRESLLNRLKDWDDQTSWKEFFETYGRLIHSLATKAGLNDAEAQDVVQKTVVSVAKKIGDFQYDPKRGSFKSWLFLITRRRIADQFRKRAPAVALPVNPDQGTSRTDTIERIPDDAHEMLEKLWEEDWRENLMEAAMERVRRRAEPIEYQMFDLHVIKGWPVKKVASRLGVKNARVYFAKYKIASWIKKEIKRLQKGEF